MREPIPTLPCDARVPRAGADRAVSNLHTGFPTCGRCGHCPAQPRLRDAQRGLCCLWDTLCLPARRKLEQKGELPQAGSGGKVGFRHQCYVKVGLKGVGICWPYAWLGIRGVRIQ